MMTSLASELLQSSISRISSNTVPVKLNYCKSKEEERTDWQQREGSGHWSSGVLNKIRCLRTESCNKLHLLSLSVKECIQYDGKRQVYPEAHATLSVKREATSQLTPSFPPTLLSPLLIPSTATLQQPLK